MVELTKAENAKFYDVAKKLMRGLNATGVGIHLDLIASYLQESFVAGRSGHWIIEEAAQELNDQISGARA